MYFKIKILSEKRNTNISVGEIFWVFSCLFHYSELCFPSGYKEEIGNAVISGKNVTAVRRDALLLKLVSIIAV